MLRKVSDAELSLHSWAEIFLTGACQLFGSSGHVKRPQNGTLHSYTACLPADADESRHVKTIANTRYVERPLGPHHFSYKVAHLAFGDATRVLTL